MAVGNNVDYLAKLDSCRRSDQEREDIVRDLLFKYNALCLEHADKIDDLENEVNSRRLMKRERDIAKAEAEAAMQRVQEMELKVKLSQDSDPMVGVFIDGDGYVFPRELIIKGEEGGEEAAHHLLTAIKKTLQETYPGQNTDSWKIMVQVVVNMCGLGKTLKKLDEVTFFSKELPAFAVGFNHGARHTFSMIDVGEGKERADVKIRKMVETMLPHCKQIYFGGCHDTGYASWLEQYKRDPTIAPKFTLLMHGVPHDRIASLNFKMADYSGIFRPNPGNDVLRFASMAPRAQTPPSQPPSRHFRQASQASFSNGEYVPSADMSTPAITGPLSPVLNNDGGARFAPFVPPAPFPPPPPSNPGPQNYAPALTQRHAPSSSAASGGAPGSWADLGPKSGPKVIEIKPRKPTTPPKYYVINQESERLDKPLPKFDNAANIRFNNKIKQMGGKFCNMYHLVGPSACPLGDSCKHQHGERLPDAERLVLQNIARTLPCGKRPGCDNVDCPYSHHCRHGKQCEHDYSCKLSDTHYYSLRPAMRVYENGKYEPITDGNF